MVHGSRSSHSALLLHAPESPKDVTVPGRIAPLMPTAHRCSGSDPLTAFKSAAPSARASTDQAPLASRLATTPSLPTATMTSAIPAQTPLKTNSSDRSAVPSTNSPGSVGTKPSPGSTSTASSAVSATTVSATAVSASTVSAATSSTVSAVTTSPGVPPPSGQPASAKQPVTASPSRSARTLMAPPPAQAGSPRVRRRSPPSRRSTPPAGRHSPPTPRGRTRLRCVAI